MKNYAVCLNTSDDARPDDWWIEFYWAEDTDHAEEQAENANPGCAVVCVAVVTSASGDEETTDVWRKLP